MADFSSDKAGGVGLEYWLQWQVAVCGLIIILPFAIAVNLLRKKGASGGGSVRPADMWAPCWKNLHPRWLLFYRVFAFAALTYLLYETVVAFGFFVFFFYTQWTFALVMVYFALATVVSIRGCRNSPAQSGDRDKILKKDSEERNYGTTSSSNQRKRKGYIKLEYDPSRTSDEQQLGFLENLLLIIYQGCAGAVILTDIVFWCLLLPFMAGENFQLTLLIGCMHSVNAVFLIIESALNHLPFSWFGLIYFIFWSVSYVAFQWVLHACCITWWPYPFLDLSTPWAPLWHLGLALVHLPCYGSYVLLVKAKNAIFSRMFPHAFIRVPTSKKQA